MGLWGWRVLGSGAQPRGWLPGAFSAPTLSWAEGWETPVRSKGYKGGESPTAWLAVAEGLLLPHVPSGSASGCVSAGRLSVCEISVFSGLHDEDRAGSMQESGIRSGWR